MTRCPTRSSERGRPLAAPRTPHQLGRWQALASRVWRDDRGQDLVEYALLTAFIGVAGAAAWVSIRGSLGTTYDGYDSSIESLWQSPAPGSTP